MSKQKSSKWRRYGAAGLLLLLALSAGGYVLIRMGLEHVRLERIRLRGLKVLTEGELLPLVSVDTTRSLFDLDEDALETAMATHPWVRRVEVTRWINGTLEFSVEERHPRLLALDDTGRMRGYIDAEGIHLPWRPGIKEVMPVVRGAVPDSASGAWGAFLHLLETDPEAARLVAEVRVMPEGDLELLTIPTPYQSGLPVRLGRTDVEERWRTFRAFWEQVVLEAPRRFDYIDIRFANQVVTREHPINSP